MPRSILYSSSVAASNFPAGSLASTYKDKQSVPVQKKMKKKKKRFKIRKEKMIEKPSLIVLSLLASLLHLPFAFAPTFLDSPAALSFAPTHSFLGPLQIDCWSPDALQL